MEDYLKQREQLITEDRAQRVDSARMQSLTHIEQKAESIVRAIRAAEAVSVWGVNGTTIFDYLPDDKSPNVFPGMAFLTARNIAVHTQLFQILSRMPKGALLHAHLDATVKARVLLKLALEQPAMHVRAANRITPNNLRATLPEFKALPQDQWTSLASLTEDSYVPNEYVPLHKARQNFDQSLGGPEAFDDWVVSALEINPSEAYGTHNTTAKIWAKFTSTFMVSGNLCHFLPLWRKYVREFLLSSVDDGISYVEPRINFWYKYMTGADGQENVTHRECLVAFDEVLNEVKAELKRQGREDEFVGAKIIYTTLRMDQGDNVEWYLEDCLALKKEFPHLIAGFDLVGHEDSLKPLTDYIEPLTKFKARQKELGLDIPLLLHAGETLGDGSAADMNLYDAILLGTKRIGHGYSLVKHPKLMEICKEKTIALEVCPISNEVLRLTTSMPMHPLPIMINHGLPVALSSDDPSAWGSTGLTYDFYQVLVSTEVSGLITMGELARDSIKYSCLEDAEKERALALYEKQWLKFTEWVVHEYSAASADGTRKMPN
ncbi:uncharacterized protein FIBRA_06582 [Fibroporia radiculosa]|uniref:Adenosine deaminase n=1 Tax=Fibroporia radiculosa TaxID=599839 RepID=J4GT06_9APHY|nr:uncharacterized protein FIBRA_06582 [Fibroporia radiculosa]CCM04405.1 predicted protein [Fibroporia radiculosa]